MTEPSVVDHTWYQPQFGSIAEERLHRKQRLAAGFRIFAKFGFEEGVAGHITARDPERLDHFWVNPFGMAFAHIRTSDLILANHQGEVVEGEGGVNVAALAIHSALHQARPDVVAAAHSHSLYGKSWSTLGRLLDPLTQDACAFFEDHALFDDYTGVVVDQEEEAHRPRTRRREGGDPAQPRPAHRGPLGRRGGVVVRDDGALVSGAIAGRGGRQPDPDLAGGGAPHQDAGR